MCTHCVRLTGIHESLVAVRWKATAECESLRRVVLGRSDSDDWEGLGRDYNTESSKRKSDDEEMDENSTVPARRESTNSSSVCVALVLRVRFLC